MNTRLFPILGLVLLGFGLKTIAQTAQQTPQVEPTTPLFSTCSQPGKPDSWQIDVHLRMPPGGDLPLDVAVSHPLPYTLAIKRGTFTGLRLVEVVDVTGVPSQADGGPYTFTSDDGKLVLTINEDVAPKPEGIPAELTDKREKAVVLTSQQPLKFSCKPSPL